MYGNIAAAMVLWNEAHRIEALVERLRPYFATIAIGVQDSTDNTLELAMALTDRVVRDEHRGFGDATFGPLVLPLIGETWTFKIDGDEMPSVELLDSLGEAVAMAEHSYQQAIWVPFRSWIEDEEWDQRHGHVRVFRTELGWPKTMHSSPDTDRVLVWNKGWIEHRKSLDEHVSGYLGYFDRSGSNPGWIEHNKAMIYHACMGTAASRGWDYVKAHAWWPRVERLVFGGAAPEPPEL